MAEKTRHDEKNPEIPAVPEKTIPQDSQDGPPAFYPMAGAAKPDGKKWIKYPPRPPVRVLLQPEEKVIELPRAKTARAVLTALGLRECTALVVRDGELLTPDRQVLPGDNILVRKVTSSG